MMRWRSSLVSRTAVVASNDCGSAFAVDVESAFGIARWLWSSCSGGKWALFEMAMMFAVAGSLL